MFGAAREGRESGRCVARARRARRCHRASSFYDDYTRDDGSEEDEEDEDYDEDDDEDLEQDPPFKYEYGFNALSFVADYLRAHNPNNPDKDFEEEFSGSDEDKPPATPPEEMDEVTKLLS